MNNTTSDVPSLEEIQTLVNISGYEHLMGVYMSTIKKNASFGQNYAEFYISDCEKRSYFLKEFKRMGFEAIEFGNIVTIKWPCILDNEEGGSHPILEDIITLTKNCIVTKNEIKQKAAAFVDEEIKTTIRKAALVGFSSIEVDIPRSVHQGFLDDVQLEFRNRGFGARLRDYWSRSIYVDWAPKREETRETSETKESCLCIIM